MHVYSVLGADSLLGGHVIDILRNRDDVSIRQWSNHHTSFHQNEASLIEAIAGADVIINCHEQQDLTILPDISGLNHHNVQLVRWLVEHSSVPIVHLSSSYVQCSNRWPNISEPECLPSKYINQWPFKAYCQSKWDAEKILEAASHDQRSIILRSVPVYGEGDYASIVTDSIRAAEKMGSIPLIGDRGGVMQMAYAGNVASAFVLAADRLIEEEEKEETSIPGIQRCEVFIVADNYLKEDIYTSFIQPLAAVPRKLRIWSHCLPVYPLYWIYSLFALLLSLVNRIVPISHLPIAKLPDACWLFLFFHHWCYFNTRKAEDVLGFSPPFTQEQAIQRCQRHYQELSLKHIRRFSFQPLSQEQ